MFLGPATSSTADSEAQARMYQISKLVTTVAVLHILEAATIDLDRQGAASQAAPAGQPGAGRSLGIANVCISLSPVFSGDYFVRRASAIILSRSPALSAFPVASSE